MLYSLLQGISIGFGFIIGLFICGIIFIAIKAMFKKYKPSDLLEPFQNYEKKLIDEERYEEVSVLRNILTYLKLGKLHDDIDKYKIEKKETSLSDYISLEDKEEEYKNVLLNKHDKDNFVKKLKYVVVGKKEV